MERLSEGADGDYTIDPARGTLTLSPRNLFRRDQLTVEYEESLDDYQRTMAGALGWKTDSSVHQSLALRGKAMTLAAIIRFAGMSSATFWAPAQWRRESPPPNASATMKPDTH
jgi:hypothetical protein